MNCTPLPRLVPRWVAGALLVAACAAGVTHAQNAPPSEPDASSISLAASSAAVPESGIVQTSCSSCGGGPGGGTLCGPGAPASGGCGTCCIPGRNYCCSDDDCHSKFGHFCKGFYQCICCPDPCYEPCWLAVADAGFFLDAARPITQMRLRYTHGWDLTTPDRAEYFFARARTTPNQLEPGGPQARHGFGKGPACIASSVDFQELSLYVEAAMGGFGFFIDTPYRHIDPQTAPISGNYTTTTPAADAMTPFAPGGAATVIPQGLGPLPNDVILTNGATVPAVLPGTAPTMIPAGTRLVKGTQLAPGTVVNAGAVNVIPQSVTTSAFTPVSCYPQSGFADLIIGTKSMLLDCQLMQLTFQFKTFLPTGNFTQGLGVGHVSLEPSLLCNLCLFKDTYLQSQFAYWIPIGGDALYQSNIFHMHFSLNRVLCCPCPGVQVIGNVELNEWTVGGGAYTDTEFLGINPNTGALTPISRSGTDSFVSAGPGIRLIACDKIDFGVGSAFALTSDHWANQELRADFRWRY